MNEDNRKVNSGTPETQSRSTKALDEITDGFFDLSKLYSTAPSKKPSAQPKPQLSREEQLRLRDQKRRELEMQAIREDIEGIFIEEEYRKRGLARELLEACQKRAKEQGCAEFASDCELDNEASLKFHMKMEFVEANRIICFTKKLN